MPARKKTTTESYESIRDRLGDAILASDRSVEAVTDIMRGAGYSVFSRMDSADNWGGVPEWHAPLRRWRNSCRAMNKILNEREVSGE